MIVLGTYILTLLAISVLKTNQQKKKTWMQMCSQC